MRGARKLTVYMTNPDGIIPACAGSTTCVQIGVNRKWDHPRMCGEHAWAFSLTSSKSGSSPHVRGARGFMLSEAVHCGIIPACAGSTPQMTHSISITWDHPRMCGEHIVKHVRPCSKRGSSPHVRGARSLRALAWSRSGIIPACAGSTRFVAQIMETPRDHPRMCGEHA